MNMNSVYLTGNLVRDPELKTVGDNVLVASFTVAVNENIKKNDGTYESRPSYFDCETWENNAQRLSDRFKKGDPILVHGKLRTDSWKTPDGQNRSRVKVRVLTFESLLRKKRDNNVVNQEEPTNTDDSPF